MDVASGAVFVVWATLSATATVKSEEGRSGCEVFMMLSRFSTGRVQGYGIEWGVKEGK